MQPNGRETREVTGANRVALGTRQAENTRNGAGEPMADEEDGDNGEMTMEGAEVEKDVTMSETTCKSTYACLRRRRDQGGNMRDTVAHVASGDLRCRSVVRLSVRI